MNLKQGTITEPQHYRSNSRSEFEMAFLLSIYRSLLLWHTHRITLGLIYSEYPKLDDNFMWTKKKATAVVWKPTLGVSQVGESSAKMSICSQNEATKATRGTWEQPSWDSGQCLFFSLYFLNYFLLHISQGRNFKTSCT